MTRGRDTDPPLLLPPAVRREIARRARGAYPREACGLLVGRRAGAQVVVEEVARARNVAQGRDRYELEPRDWFAAWRDAEGRGAEVLGVWHSHPDAPAVPSRADVAAGWTGYSYLIAAVSASGVSELRCWRLGDRAFSEQRVVAVPEP